MRSRRRTRWPDGLLLALVGAVVQVMEAGLAVRAELAPVLDEAGLVSRERWRRALAGQGPAAPAAQAGECVEVVDVAAAGDVVAAELGLPLRVVAPPKGPVTGDPVAAPVLPVQ